MISSFGFLDIIDSMSDDQMGCSSENNDTSTSNTLTDEEER